MLKALVIAHDSRTNEVMIHGLLRTPKRRRKLSARARRRNRQKLEQALTTMSAPGSGALGFGLSKSGPHNQLTQIGSHRDIRLGLLQ